MSKSKSIKLSPKYGVNPIAWMPLPEPYKAGSEEA